jgi:hypothetical protein
MLHPNSKWRYLFFMAKKKKPIGPRSQKSEKRKKSKGRDQSKQNKPVGQTNEPFEQDAKRRIGQHSGTGTPPLMKK